MTHPPNAPPAEAARNEVPADAKLLRELAVDLERVAVYDTDRSRATQFTTTAARLRALAGRLQKLEEEGKWPQS